jgi:hypothetical protein
MLSGEGREVPFMVEKKFYSKERYFKKKDLIF